MTPPQRLAELLPDLIADLATRHNQNRNPPMKFRKKPVVIEAMQYRPYDEDSVDELILWLDQGGVPFMTTPTRELIIPTLEDGADGRAKHVASAGDWIIRGVQGEHYPVKPDIFAATYEPAEDVAS